jgi:uncharacterized DUF497 family protein
VPPAIHKLSIPDFAAEKLGRRGISVTEALQLPWNDHDLEIDRSAPPGSDRRLLLGESNGGRALTLVVEPTRDPTDWLVITGWESAERRLR